MYNPNTYGMSDLAKRKAFEQRHVSADVEPMYGHGKDGWPKLWLWAVCGAVIALVLVLA